MSEGEEGAGPELAPKCIRCGASRDECHIAFCVVRTSEGIIPLLAEIDGEPTFITVSRAEDAAEADAIAEPTHRPSPEECAGLTPAVGPEGLMEWACHLCFSAITDALEAEISEGDEEASGEDGPEFPEG